LYKSNANLLVLVSLLTEKRSKTGSKWLEQVSLPVLPGYCQPALINIRTWTQNFMPGVIVIAQKAHDLFPTHFMQAVSIQNELGDFCAAHAVVGPNLAL
jgi:hypothetical protein